MTEKQILISKWPIWLVYVIKGLDLVAFLSLSPPFFPSRTSAIMSNRDQSYLIKVNVLITLDAKRADKMSSHLRI